MPKQKTIKPVSKVTALQQPLWAKPELWLGLSTLIVVGIVAARSNFWRPSTDTASSTTATEQAMEESKKAEEAKKAEEMEIKRLADTAGTIHYVVAPKDSFAKIAKLVCDDEAFAEIIAKENGYGRNRSLQSGDVLTISCK